MSANIKEKVDKGHSDLLTCGPLVVTEIHYCDTLRIGDLCRNKGF